LWFNSKIYKVEGLEFKKIKKISSGEDNLIAISSNNKVYSNFNPNLIREVTFLEEEFKNSTPIEVSAGKGLLKKLRNKKFKI
jgi:hypothetical protein